MISSARLRFFPFPIEIGSWVGETMGKGRHGASPKKEEAGCLGDSLLLYILFPSYLFLPTLPCRPLLITRLIPDPASSVVLASLSPPRPLRFLALFAFHCISDTAKNWFFLVCLVWTIFRETGVWVKSYPYFPHDGIEATLCPAPFFLIEGEGESERKHYIVSYHIRSSHVFPFFLLSFLHTKIPQMRVCFTGGSFLLHFFSFLWMSNPFFSPLLFSST